jgi:hypothetical protein
MVRVLIWSGCWAVSASEPGGPTGPVLSAAVRPAGTRGAAGGTGRQARDDQGAMAAMNAYVGAAVKMLAREPGLSLVDG